MASIRVHGTANVIKNFGKKQLQMEAGALRWVNQSTRKLEQTVAKNISFTCHSLADLANKDLFPPEGHPYGKKHLNNPHSPYYQVHMQSGKMRGYLESDIAMDGREIRGAVGYTEESEMSLHAPSSSHSYLRCIIFGTNIGEGGMIERDFLNGSLNEIKAEVQQRLLKEVGRAARRGV